MTTHEQTARQPEKGGATQQFAGSAASTFSARVTPDALSAKGPVRCDTTAPGARAAGVSPGADDGISWRNLKGVTVAPPMSDDDTLPERDSTRRVRPVARLELHWVYPPMVPPPGTLEGRQIEIGRDVASGFRLEFASVSRRHAEIYRDGPVYAVRDLGSRNGTYLNGARIAHGVLAAGDILRIGDCVGVVLAGADGRPVTEIAPDLFAGDGLASALDDARRAAPSRLPIVLVGETGTGKERVSRAIHAWSGRQGGFHAINCAAFAENLVESELFGHAKGAFTGAHAASPGRVRAAHRGTLLLDELADLPLRVQPKLLRLLEEDSVIPVGDTRPHPVDVRIVAATQTPLEELVKRGVFRQDLRARLSGLVVRLPPLRERRLEIVPLFLRLLTVHTGGRAPSIEAKFAEALCLHDWPDNVRELDLLTRQLLALNGGEPVLKRAMLPAVMRPSLPAPNESFGEAPGTRSEHDLLALRRALAASSGNVKAAAQSLGFSRQRAYRLLSRENVDDARAGTPARDQD